MGIVKSFKEGVCINLETRLSKMSVQHWKLFFLVTWDTISDFPFVFYKYISFVIF